MDAATFVPITRFSGTLKKHSFLGRQEALHGCKGDRRVTFSLLSIAAQFSHARPIVQILI